MNLGKFIVFIFEAGYGKNVSREALEALTQFDFGSNRNNDKHDIDDPKHFQLQAEINALIYLEMVTTRNLNTPSNFTSPPNTGKFLALQLLNILLLLENEFMLN